LGASFPACAFSLFGTFTFLQDVFSKPMSKARGASPRRNPASRESSARRTPQERGFPLLQQGDLGEVAFVHKAISLGFVVAKPYGHIHRYDFIVEGGQDLWRVQVKTSIFQRKGSY
jgi:hypothetical protein